LADNPASINVAGLTLSVAVWFLEMYVLVASAALGIPILEKTPSWVVAVWAVPGLVAMAALIGAPATPGAPARTALHAGLSEARWLWWLSAVAVESLLASAALRCAFAPHLHTLARNWPADRQAMVAFNRPTLPPISLPIIFEWLDIAKYLLAPIAGLAVAAAPLILLGTQPAIWFQPEIALGAVPTLDIRGWVGWLVPLAATIVLPVAYWLLAHRAKLQTYIAQGGAVISHVLDMGWLYALTINSFRRVARWVGAFAALTEGKGALVWTLLIIALALLYLEIWR
jgi:hypothetical protein